MAMKNNVVPVDIRGILPANSGCAIFVGNDEKVFVIQVEHNMGAIIGMFMRDTPKERPLTHDLIANVFKGFDITVERVVITDTLSTDLIWNSMEYVSASHQNTWYLQNGVLHFIFDPIFLPDSVSDEPGSHGFVKFRMRPVNTLLVGAQIENVANIHFDFNEPVITDPALFAVEQSTGLAVVRQNDIAIFPNPASNILYVELDAPYRRSVIRTGDGRMVRSYDIHGSRAALDISGLANGPYMIELQDASGRRTVLRFVKQ